MTRATDNGSFELLSYIRGGAVYTGSWRHTEHTVVVRYGGREVHTSGGPPENHKETAQALLAEIVEGYEGRSPDPGCPRTEITLPAAVRNRRIP